MVCMAKFIQEKYKKEVEALYGHDDHVNVETIIKYQDGRTTSLKTSLEICVLKQDEKYDTAGKRKWWAFWHQE